MDENTIKNLITKEVERQLSFTARKVTDTPSDAFSVVNRRYTNLYGTTANRPSSIIGQRYFDTSLATNGKLIVWNGTGWVDGSGTYV